MHRWFDYRNDGWKLLSPDDGGGADGAGGSAEGSTGASGTDAGADTGTDVGSGTDSGENGGADLAEELAKARADAQKFKAAMDKAAKEIAEAKRQLRAKQSAEEIAAEEKKAADEKAAQEMDELRREVARNKAIKSVMGKLGTDEDTSGKIAEYLYGAEDVDAALTEIQRAWTAREKALKLEYGKVPPPGSGGANGEDEETTRAIKLAKEMGQERAKVAASVRDQLGGLIR